MKLRHEGGDVRSWQPVVGAMWRLATVTTESPQVTRARRSRRPLHRAAIRSGSARNSKCIVSRSSLSRPSQ
jgi:hypothetical protein